MYTSPFFAQKEFACKCGCGFGSKPEHIATDIYFALHLLRVKLGVAFKINSAARCTKHNKKVGGGTRSTHLAAIAGSFIGKSRGVDIDTTTWSIYQRGEAVTMALAMGLRVGIDAKFLHFDCERMPYYKEGLWNYGADESSSD